jgi:hypothetical protein
MHFFWGPRLQKTSFFDRANFAGSENDLQMQLRWLLILKAHQLVIQKQNEGLYTL